MPEGRDEVTDSDSAANRAMAVQRAEFREVLGRLEAIETTLSRVQALAARIHQAEFAEATRLDAARNSPTYSRAYEPSPLVSVRIATFNGGRVLEERTIPSLLAQTHSNWECLIVGDATEDDTAERIDRVGDPRIRFWNLPVRGPYPSDPEERWFCAGTAPANEGIRAAAGQWVAALDHDDAWDPDHLEVLLAEARLSRAEVVYSRIRVVDEATGRLSGSMGAWPPVRGEFGFLASIVHAGLRFFEYDPFARFADEPGDWNLARRMWESGARFQFIERETATHFFTPKHAAESTVDQTLRELRQWVEDLDALRWDQLAEAEARRVALEQQLVEERANFARAIDALVAKRARRRWLRGGK
jgi:hypothetical protein